MAEGLASDMSVCLSTCIEHVGDIWFRTLEEINPTLSSEEVRSQVGAVTEALVAGMDEEILDAESLMHIGSEMDTLDALDLADVQRIQACILQAFSEALPAEVWEAQRFHLTNLLFGLAAGLYTGKSRRAARFNLQVTSRMGHDLKTPINSITGFSRVILKGIDGPITDFQREDLISIYEAGQRILTMVNDLYAIKKQDAARSPVYDQPFPVADLLADIVRTVQPLAAQHDHMFTVQAVDELGMMALDASRVRWILLCSLMYFVRMISDGELTLRVSRDYADGAWIVFTLIVRSDSKHPSVLGGAATLDESHDEHPPFIFPNCPGACEELGGDMKWTEEEGVWQVVIRFPALDTEPV